MRERLALSVLENYHRDTEQIAFSPGRLVPGIEPTPDPLLQFRLWLYQDAQYHRLGVNYHQIPVNCPFMTKSLHPQARDGPMRVDANGAHEAHYFPNSFHGAAAPQPDPSAAWQPSAVPKGLPAAATRCPINTRDAGDLRADYRQAEEFWRNGLSEKDRLNLYSNIAFALRTVPRKEVQVRFLLACHRVHADYARGVLRALDAECKRANAEPQVSWDELESIADKVKDRPLVDVNNGYKPVEISI